MGNTKNNYVPNPIDISGVELPRDIEKLREILAENNHDIWAQDRLADGWVYGQRPKKERKVIKRNPCLVRYDELPEKEKEYDRKMAEASLKSIYKKGFCISKNVEGNVMLVGRYSKTFIDNFEKKAKDKKLKVVSFKSWNVAKAALDADVTNWHSIVFDCEGADDDIKFMRIVIDDLNSIFHSTYNEIPWYILPYKKKDSTDILIKLAVGKDRELKNWGKVDYAPNDSADISLLIENIANSKQYVKSYRMELMYGEVFNTINNHFENPNSVKELLCKALIPLHYPSDFHSYKPTDFANHLRQVFESILMVFIKHKYIPNYVEVNTQNGLEVKRSKHYNGSPNMAYCMQHLENAKWFDEEIKTIIKRAKVLLNEGSHLASGLEARGLYYTITSYALQLADVIIWLGKFIELTNWTKKYLVGKECILQKNARQNYYCVIDGVECFVKPKYAFASNCTSSKKVRIRKVSIFNDFRNKDFLFIAEL